MRAKLIFTLFALFLAVSAQAAVIDIKVLPEGDGVVGKNRSDYNSYVHTGFITDASPNAVYHYSWAGNDGERDTFMQFSLAGFSGSSADIESATFNFNILETSSNPDGFWSTAGTLKHANYDTGATGDASERKYGNAIVGHVSVNAPTGWTSFNITDCIKNDVDNGCAWSVFSFLHDQYAGFTFSSGEDAEFAPYLSIVTAGQAVPLPGAAWLLGSGLAGLAALRRRRK